MSEHTLWQYIQGLVPKGNYTRVETGDTGPGMPDVYYRLKMWKCSGWLELKDARHPNAEIPFKDDRDGLHLTQLAWIRSEVAYGGIVTIVARVGLHIHWIPGHLAYKFNGNPDLQSLAVLTIGGRRITERNVQTIRKLLTGAEIL